MNNQKIRDFIVAYVERVAAERDIKLGVIDDAFDLVESGLLDSMGFVGLIASLEQELGLSPDLSDMDTDELTIGGLARLMSPPVN